MKYLLLFAILWFIFRPRVRIAGPDNRVVMDFPKAQANGTLMGKEGEMVTGSRCDICGEKYAGPAQDCACTNGGK